MRDPLGAGFVRQIVAQRTDQHETRSRARAPRPCAPRSICLLMPPPPTMLFFNAMPPKASTMLAVLGDLLPGDVALRQILVVADDVRQQHRGCAGAVAVDRADIAAQAMFRKRWIWLCAWWKRPALAQP